MPVNPPTRPLRFGRVAAIAVLVALGVIGRPGFETRAFAHPDPIIDVYIIAGQSNANGYGREADLTPTQVQQSLRVPEADDRILFAHQLSLGAGGVYDRRGWGPLELQVLRQADWFGPEYGAALTALASFDSFPAGVEKVALLKAAASGSPLAYWTPGNFSGVYERHVGFMQQQLGELAALYPDHRLRVRAMLWVQGEQDALDDTATATYGGRLVRFVDTVERSLGLDHDLPLVFAALNTNGRDIARRISINNQVTAIASTRTDWAITGSTAPLPLIDSIHFNATGQLRLGEMLMAPAMAMATPPEVARPGDGDCSGRVELRDAALVAQLVAATRTATTDCPPGANQVNGLRADVDGDGSVDTADVESLLDCLMAAVDHDPDHDPSGHCHPT